MNHANKQRLLVTSRNGPVLPHGVIVAARLRICKAEFVSNFSGSEGSFGNEGQFWHKQCQKRRLEDRGKWSAVEPPCKGWLKSQCSLLHVRDRRRNKRWRVKKSNIPVASVHELCLICKIFCGVGLWRWDIREWVNVNILLEISSNVPSTYFCFESLI